MATLGSLISDVSKRLLDPNNVEVSASDVAAAINEAVSYYSDDVYSFNQKSATVTMTAGNPVIPVPSDFLIELKPDGFVLIDSDLYYPMVRISQSDFDCLNTQTAGRPFHYTWKAGQYLTYLYPQQDYTVEARYLKKYPSIVNNDDSNDFTLEAANLLMYRSLSRLMAELRQDSTMEDYYTARADDERRVLLNFANRYASAGYNQLDSCFFY